MHSVILRFPEHLRLSPEKFFLFRQANPALKMEQTATGEIRVEKLDGRLNLLLPQMGEAWSEKNGFGPCFDSSTGFRLPNGATRSPDAAWVVRERWEALTEAQQVKFPPLCPDFVIELKSDSDGLKPAQEKMQEWLENGCRLAWLLDPAEAKAYLYRPGKGVAEYDGFAHRLSGEDVLPAFELDLGLLR